MRISDWSSDVCSSDLTTTSTILWLLFFSAAFTILGVLYSRRDRDSLEDYVIARNSQSSIATMLTLLASTLGAWILFSPAQAATWGGLAAVIGYAIGALSDRKSNTSELQSLMRISYAVFCLKKKKNNHRTAAHNHQ